MKTLDEVDRDIAARFRLVLKAKGMPMAMLAKKIGVSARTVQHYAAGKTGIPASVIERAAFWLDVSPDFILTGYGAVFDTKLLLEALQNALSTAREVARLNGDREVTADHLLGVTMTFYSQAYLSWHLARVDGEADELQRLFPAPLGWADRPKGAGD